MFKALHRSDQSKSDLGDQNGHAVPNSVSTAAELGDISSSWATAADAGKLLAPVRAGLALVEVKMKAVDSMVFAPLADAFVDLIGSGGKRLRPALALMTAEFGESGYGSTSYPAVVALAASVEMLHTATLVHDDVIDGALLRRGAPTLNATWTRGATVLAGNYMFGRAAHFAAETGAMRVIRIFSSTLQIIVDGELRQLFARNHFDQAKDEYYERIYAKTASLFAAATEAAAVLSYLPESTVQQMKEYGYRLGMAFQIVDDILDFTGDESTLGKPAGSDLRQGTLTLPFFYYLRQHRNAAYLVNRLRECSELAAEGDDEAWRELMDQVVTDLRHSDAIEEARDEAASFLERARSSLDTLPDNLYRQSLIGLCDFVVQRTH